MKMRLVLLMSLVFGPVFLHGAFADSEVTTIEITKRCQREGQYKCNGTCMDGWSTGCYYDSSKYQIENDRSLDSQQEKCYAYRDMSVCAPCRNSYKIGDKNVNCEQFYRSINEKNKDCNGCLKQSFTAGG